MERKSNYSVLAYPLVAMMLVAIPASGSVTAFPIAQGDVRFNTLYHDLGYGLQGITDGASTLQFLSDEPIVAVSDASLSGYDGSLDQLRILPDSLSATTALSFSLNLFTAGTVSVVLDDALEVISLNLTPGLSVFTVSGLDAQILRSVELRADVPFTIHDVKQTYMMSRVAAPLVSTPEPASLVLFGTGLLGLGIVLKKSKKTSIRV